MSEKVVALPGIVQPKRAAAAQKPDVSVVEALENMLQRARAGQVVGIAMVCLEPGGVIGDTWRCSPDVSAHLLVAGMTYLLHEMCAQATQDV